MLFMFQQSIPFEKQAVYSEISCNNYIKSFSQGVNLTNSTSPLQKTRNWQVFARVFQSQEEPLQDQRGCLPLTNSITQRLSSSLEVTSKPHSKKMRISKPGSQYAASLCKTWHEIQNLSHARGRTLLFSLVSGTASKSYSLSQPINFLFQ